MTWTVLLSVLQRRELKVQRLDIAGNALYDKAFCLLNPFVAGGRIHLLAVGSMKGDQTMVEGISASLLLNRNIKESSLSLDDSPMDCESKRRE